MISFILRRGMHQQDQAAGAWIGLNTDLLAQLAHQLCHGVLTAVQMTSREAQLPVEVARARTTFEAVT